MRSLAFMGALASAASLPALASMGAGVARFVRREREPGEERAAPKVARAREEGKAKDPYFGIKTRGRRAAGERLALQMAAFEKTPVGKRNARGRMPSNPFKTEHRRAAYMDALRAGEDHAGAMKSARLINA